MKKGVNFVKFPHLVYDLTFFPGLIMSSGDVIAQCWLEQVPIQKIDWSRTARFGIIGCIFVVIYFVAEAFSKPI